MSSTVERKRERDRGEEPLENSGSVCGVNWDSSFCTLISRVASQPYFLPSFAASPHLEGWGKIGGKKGGLAACCAIVNTLHISRTIGQPLSTSYRHLFNHFSSLFPFSPYPLASPPPTLLPWPHTDALQLAKIDRAKVQDGTGSMLRVPMGSLVDA